MKLQELNEDCLFKIYCYAPQLRECINSLQKYPDIRELGYEYGDEILIDYRGFKIHVKKSYLDKYWEIINSDDAHCLRLSVEKMEELNEYLKKILSNDYLLKEALKNHVFKITYDQHQNKKSFEKMNFWWSFNTSLCFYLYH